MHGTVDDGTEVKRGTDPLNAEDDVVKIGVRICTGRYLLRC